MASRRGTDVGLRKRLRPARRLRKRTPPYAPVFLTVGRDCSQCTYVQFGVKIIFIDPWDMVGILAVVLGTQDTDLENLG